MTPTSCPTCKGRCCVTGGALKVDHGGARNVRHDCPDCEDGTVGPAPARTAEQKHAAVEAWLRAPDEPDGYKPCPLCGSTIPDEPNELDDLRAEVERLRSGADEARRAERAEIVAWLRQEAARYRGLEPVLSPAARALEATAYLIETHATHTSEPKA